MLRIISVILLSGLLGTTANAAPENTITSPTPVTIAKTNSNLTTNTTAAAVTVATITPLDTSIIENILGLKGHLDKQTQTYKVTLPRNDLNIVINGVKLTPAMGLTSWAAFKKTGNTATVKADIVVTENQANTILSLALDNHLAVIALHNHLLWESPRVMFVHLEGVGTEKELATAIKTVFTKTQDTNDEGSDFPLAAIDATDTTLNPAIINKIMGTNGTLNNGSFQIHLSKLSQNDKTKHPIINASATFAGSDTEAVIDGDLALQSSDLHSVLEALHKAGIAIVALHEHEGNKPETRMVYLHYFGVGQTDVLARGLHNALNAAKANDDAVAASVALMTPPKLAIPADATKPAVAKTGDKSALTKPVIVVTSQLPAKQQTGKPTEPVATQQPVKSAMTATDKNKMPPAGATSMADDDKAKSIADVSLAKHETLKPIALDTPAKPTATKKVTTVAVRKHEAVKPVALATPAKPTDTKKVTTVVSAKHEAVKPVALATPAKPTDTKKVTTVVSAKHKAVKPVALATPPKLTDKKKVSVASAARHAVVKPVALAAPAKPSDTKKVAAAATATKHETVKPVTLVTPAKHPEIKKVTITALATPTAHSPYSNLIPLSLAKFDTTKPAEKLAEQKKRGPLSAEKHSAQKKIVKALSAKNTQQKSKAKTIDAAADKKQA